MERVLAEKTLDQLTMSVFCGSISMMLHAGIPAGEGCALFAQDETGPVAEAARAISEAMAAGGSFAEAAKNCGAFPEYALGVFRTAEYSGHLEEGLGGLAVYYDRQHALTQRLRSTLFYPAALMLLMCVVLGVLTFFVLPMFESVYIGLTGSLAASSYAYVIWSSVIAKVSLVLAAAVSACLLLAAARAGTESGRQALRRSLEKNRFTAKAFRSLAVSQLADTLSTLLSSGMDTDEALAMAKDMTGHEGVVSGLEACIADMQQGAGLADSLFRHGIFTALYGRMLAGGAESGHLEEILAELASRMSRDAEDELSGLMDAVEPILIGFLAVSVGLTLLSVMLPLLGILGAL